jgi:hypothetical protein
VIAAGFRPEYVRTKEVGSAMRVLEKAAAFN